MFAALTRIQGLFLALPIGWEALAAAGMTAWRPWQGRSWPVLAWRPLIAGVAASLGPLVGFSSFLAYTAAVAGQTPLDTKDAWGGKEFFPPWEVAAAAWRWTVEKGDALQFLNLALLVLTGVMVVLGFRRLPVAYSLYALPQFVLLATRIQPTPLTSTNRYVLVIFPAFVMLALIPWRRVRLAWGIASVLFLGILVQGFLTGSYIA